ncbi:hypothetical protein [Sphingobium yanoikuyae]|uniref:hypothetical protein n=1 Tax=Sphingobium yanoikuyae TaxID=13690 RepID=UPI0007A7328C|nr:hypothetical protein [Sphingobium yanoikuyae]
MATKYRGPKGASWAAQAFESKTAKAGGVVRRSVAAAKKANGYHDLINMARTRGYAILLGGGQIVIFCNTDRVINALTGAPI